MQSMMMSLMESAKADREEAKREREATAKNTARLEGQVQQLQQLLSTGQPGTRHAGALIPRGWLPTRYSPLLHLLARSAQG